MKKFKFQFASVLKLRQTREEEALRALAAAQRAFQAELERKANLESRLSEALLRREKLGIDSIGIDAFQLEQLHIVGTKQRITRQDQALVRAGRSVEKALRVYLFAKRQTRAIEMLREKHFAEFKRALAKKEQKELDEISVMRARMKKIGESEDEQEQTA